MASGDHIIPVDETQIVGIFHEVFDVFLQTFKPTTAFISRVAGESWIGFLIVFALFFCLFIARIGSRAGDIGAFGHSMMMVTRYGLIGCAVYFLLWLVDVAVVGPLAFFGYLLVQLANGTFSQLEHIGRQKVPSPQYVWGDPAQTYGMGDFWGNIGDFLLGNRAFLPLDLKALGLIVCALFCIRLVCFGLMAKAHAR